MDSFFCVVGHDQTKMSINSFDLVHHFLLLVIYINVNLKGPYTPLVSLGILPLDSGYLIGFTKDLNSPIRIHWISWDKVLGSISEGELGISSLFSVNWAMLFKWK